MENTTVSNSELYLWLAIEAAQSRSCQEFEDRWHALEQAVRLASSGKLAA